MSRKKFPSKYVAALFHCRSCPGVSPQRCLAPILAKSYPIFWRVWNCQAAQPHITIPASEKQKKHRKTLTTQAGFLLSEDQPLTVLGSSMMLHHCLRLRDLSMGIISLWWFSLSELWNIYSHLSRVFFYLLITFPQNVLYTLNTHPAQPILCPVPWKTHYESFEVLEIISWGTGNTR